MSAIQNSHDREWEVKEFEAFAGLVCDAVYRRCKLNTYSPQALQDAKQVCLLHVWRKRELWLHEPDISKRKGFVLGLTKSALADWRRSGESLVLPFKVSRSRWAQFMGFCEWQNSHGWSVGFSIDTMLDDHLRGSEFQAPTHWHIEDLDNQGLWLELLRTLTGRECLVILYTLQGMTQREMAELLDLTESRISQILGSIIKRARRINLREKWRQ